MNESFYDRLGVDKAADAQEIKRAYYKLVKQYPPERFPEEYKELRAAYDTLSNENKRAEYDESLLMPADAAYLFKHAEKLERIGRDAEASEVYEKILRLHPNLTKAQVALAQTFEKQGKNGKAITIWEKLCEREPENAKYAFELALVYEQRGWRKKADFQYWRSLDLDGCNVACWVALINLHLSSSRIEEGRYICDQAIRVMKGQGKESIQLYLSAAMLNAESDINKSERYLVEITRIMRTGGNQDEQPEEVVRMLLAFAKESRVQSFVKHISEMAATLPRIDDDLRKELAEAERAEAIAAMMEQGFSELFHDLFVTLNDDCDCEECRLDIMAMECHLLADRSIYRSEILRLRKEFPDLYALHADFFNELLRTKDTQKLLYRRMKILSKKGFAPAGFTEDEYEYEDEDLAPVPVQPIRRVEPKIGRNDPCPCGSGKKYKKCCGQ